MPRHRSTYKGERMQIMARPAKAVYDVIKQRSKDLGIPMGQYVADILAEHAGFPELMRELTPQEPAD